MADQFIMLADGFPHMDKDPDASLNYTWDFTQWLAKAGSGVTISSAVVTAEAGITLEGVAAITAGFVSQRISGGTIGSSYRALCRMTASNGEIDERTIVLDVRTR